MLWQRNNKMSRLSDSALATKLLRKRLLQKTSCPGPSPGMTVRNIQLLQRVADVDAGEISSALDPATQHMRAAVRSITGGRDIG